MPGRPYGHRAVPVTASLLLVCPPLGHHCSVASTDYRDRCQSAELREPTICDRFICMGIKSFADPMQINLHWEAFQCK